MVRKVCQWTVKGHGLGDTQGRRFWRDWITHQLWVLTTTPCPDTIVFTCYSLCQSRSSRSPLFSELPVPQIITLPVLMVWFPKHETSTFPTSSPKKSVWKAEYAAASRLKHPVQPVFSTAQHSAELTFTTSFHWLGVTVTATKMCNDIRRMLHSDEFSVTSSKSFFNNRLH